MAEAISVRESLQAAHDELSADTIETPAAVADDGSNQAQGAPAAEAAGAAAPEAAAAKPEGQDQAGPARGPDGKFAAKQDTPPSQEGAPAAAAPQADTQRPETAAPAGADAQPEPTRIPPSLSAAVKAQWATLPPEVQKDISRLEDSVQTAKAEWGRKGERLNRFDEIIGPRREQFALRGIDEFQAVQTLFAAQDILDRNPIAGLLEVARSYGVTPAHLAQAFGLQASGQPSGQEGQSAPTGAPDFQAALQQHLSPLVTQVQTLQQQLEHSAQQTQAAEVTRLTNQIQEFAGKPENMYFDNVSDEIVVRARQLAGNGPVTMDVIAKAYESAIWADPTIRPLLIKAQGETQAAEERRIAEDARKATEKAARDKAQRSGHAGGSVTGSPTPGSAPPNVSHGTVRDDLKATMQELGAL